MEMVSTHLENTDKALCGTTGTTLVLILLQPFVGEGRANTFTSVMIPVF